jgi:hypothetical protein
MNFKERYKSIKTSLELENNASNIKKSINKKFSEAYVETKDKTSKEAIKNIFFQISEIRKRFKINEDIDKRLKLKSKKTLISRELIRGFCRQRAPDAEIINLEDFFKESEKKKEEPFRYADAM